MVVVPFSGKRCGFNLLLMILILFLPLITPGLPVAARTLHPDVSLTLRLHNCAPGDAPTDIPVFTEDGCTPDSDHEVRITGANGTSDTAVTDANGELVYQPGAGNGPNEAGDWTFEDLDGVNQLWYLPSCWRGDLATELTVLERNIPAPNRGGGFTWDSDAATLDRDVTCDLFSIRPSGSGATPSIVHTLVVVTDAIPMMSLQPGESMSLDAGSFAIDDEVTAQIAMIRINAGERNNEETDFEADSDGAVIHADGEYKIFNGDTGQNINIQLRANTVFLVIPVPPAE